MSPEASGAGEAANSRQQPPPARRATRRSGWSTVVGFTTKSKGAASTTSSEVVTFLLSDVEGSSRLWEGDQEVMAGAIARHYALLDSAIALHGGVRPTEQGDGDSVRQFEPCHAEPRTGDNSGGLHV